MTGVLAVFDIVFIVVLLWLMGEAGAYCGMSSCRCLVGLLGCLWGGGVRV